MEEVQFGCGMLFHDVTVLATLKNCLFNTDTQVLLELYILCKKNESLRAKFPTLIPFIESMDNDPNKVCVAVQNKNNSNPLLDFYDWKFENVDGLNPFDYTTKMYYDLYHKELNVLGVSPIPTLLGNLLNISMKLDDFHKLYILDTHHPDFMKQYMESFFRANKKVELLEGTLEEAVDEINDINFFILEDAEDIRFLAKPHHRLTEVLVPGFRCNLLNADNLEETPPILALPDNLDDYRGKYNLSIKCIGIPI